MARIQKIHELIETRINGNITDFNKGCKTLTKKECLTMVIEMVDKYGYTYWDALVRVLTALDG